MKLPEREPGHTVTKLALVILQIILVILQRLGDL